MTPKIEKQILKLKSQAQNMIDKHKYNDALQIISCIASLYYQYNCKYTDKDLEDMILEIAHSVKVESCEPCRGTVLFYDGFGLERRGLSHIYLKALCEIGYKIIYVTNRKHERKLPHTQELVGQSGGCCVYLADREQILKKADMIVRTAMEHRVEKAVLYTTPSDVAGILAFENFPGTVKRYQINLTDHAFWLGVHAFDICIEFRNYGASISEFYRHIDRSKLVIQPFYAENSYQGGFQGYPFAKSDSDFVIFSGGSIYKTVDEDSTYYKMVRAILDSYPDVKFWYAGSGECDDMDLLLQDYKGRVFYTAERADLHQILENCDLYLSTYPLAGGLMSQFAASAGCYPLTLWAGAHNHGILLENTAVRTYINTLEELLDEFQKIYEDKEYRDFLGKEIRSCVISRQTFTDNLRSILESGVSCFEIKTEKIDTSKFLDLYRIKDPDKVFLETIGSLRCPAVGRIMPFYYTVSLAKRLGGILRKIMI